MKQKNKSNSKLQCPGKPHKSQSRPARQKVRAGRSIHAPGAGSIAMPSRCPAPSFGPLTRPQRRPQSQWSRLGSAAGPAQGRRRRRRRRAQACVRAAQAGGRGGSGGGGRTVHVRPRRCLCTVPACLPAPERAAQATGTQHQVIQSTSQTSHMGNKFTPRYPHRRQPQQQAQRPVWARHLPSLRPLPVPLLPSYPRPCHPPTAAAAPSFAPGTRSGCSA